MTETFWMLLRDPAHWAFELFLMVLFDGLIIGVGWRFVRKHWAHHIARDEREAPASFRYEVRDKSRDWAQNPCRYHSSPEPLWPASWYRIGMATEAIKQKAAQAEVNRKLDEITAECNCETPLQAMICNLKTQKKMCKTLVTGG